MFGRTNPFTDIVQKENWIEGVREGGLVWRSNQVKKNITNGRTRNILWKKGREKISTKGRDRNRHGNRKNKAVNKKIKKDTAVALVYLKVKDYKGRF